MTCNCDSNLFIKAKLCLGQTSYPQKKKRNPPQKKTWQQWAEVTGILNISHFSVIPFSFERANKNDWDFFISTESLTRSWLFSHLCPSTDPSQYQNVQMDTIYFRKSVKEQNMDSQSQALNLFPSVSDLEAKMSRIHRVSRHLPRMLYDRWWCPQRTQTLMIIGLCIDCE